MLQLAIKDRKKPVNLDQSRITIGRDAANTVVLENADVSGYHAEIHCDSGGVYIVDLGSSNGTSVNGKRLTKRHQLAAWDRVSFASVEAEVVDTEGRRPTQVSPAVGRPAPSATGGEWRLVGERETFEISGRHVVGRDAGCDFTLSSKAVSRRHARLELRDGRLTVTDLGSANGTFVNGKRVQESVLGVGDEVRFDVESFRVEGPDDPDQTTVRPAAGDDATRVRSAVGAAGTTTLPAATSRLEVVGGMDVQVLRPHDGEVHDRARLGKRHRATGQLRFLASRPVGKDRRRLAADRSPVHQRDVRQRPAHRQHRL